jgi:hypothetical protein
VLRTSDMSFFFPQGGIHNQPAFFSPPDDCGTLGECCFSA